MRNPGLLVAMLLVAACPGPKQPKIACPADGQLAGVVDNSAKLGTPKRDDMRFCAAARLEKLAPGEPLDDDLAPAYTRLLVAMGRLDSAIADANHRLGKAWNYGLARWVVASHADAEKIIADCKRLHAAAPVRDKQWIVTRCHDALSGISTTDAMEWVRANPITRGTIQIEK